MSGDIARLSFSRARMSVAFDRIVNILRNGTAIPNGTNVPALIEEAQTSNERVGGDNVPQSNAFRVLLPLEYVIMEGDYIVDVTTGTTATYESVSKSKSVSYDIAVAVECVLIRA
jgi:hypothetical protein